MSTAQPVTELSAKVPQVDPPAAKRPTEPGEPAVVFFDGVCGLCNRLVDFLLTRDRRGDFRLAPLQGPTARDWLGISSDQPLNSLVLVDEKGTYRKSDAVWRILARLGGRWTIPALLLRLTPRPIRNWGYDVIARNRYRWFGQKETCRLPTPEERARFLP